MTRSDHKTVDRYISKVLHSTSCPKRARSELRKRLTAQITSFAEGKENITEYMLCMEFGEPQDVAASVFDREEYKLHLNNSRKAVKALAITLIVIVSLILFAYVMIIIVRDINPKIVYEIINIK